ncbi:hypothetical protein OH76DRAFT_1394203 [Lentinus brumalis]|uniref:Uncharacterized protein n=1 Tax=Lentinus brumalis TaxID=2498619 RepID=A0A371CJU1_9APHY|nr:hypothetical protein OH76DRAFT_1394203 [Polyporus brumalis]
MSQQPIRRPWHFLVATGHQGTKYKCQICPAARSWMYLSAAIAHEDSANHTERAREVASDSDTPTSPFHEPSSPFTIPYASDDVQLDFGDELAHAPSEGDILQVHSTRLGPALPSDGADCIYDDWDGPMGDAMDKLPEDDGEWDTEEEDQAGFCFEGAGEVGTRAEEADDNAPASEELIPPSDDCAPKDGIALQDPNRFFPWLSCEDASLDAMMAFPRACFGEGELEATCWFSGKCGASGLPSVSQVKRHRTALLELCGTDPQLVEGKLGNLFSVNSFKKLVQHELANPLVCRHLHWYSEEVGDSGSEAWQFDKWRHEVPGSIAGPMVRSPEGKDYFVNEPALANVDNLGSIAPVIPVRWFMRDGGLHALAHRLYVHPRDQNAYTIDGRSALELPMSAFFSPYPDFAREHSYYNLPSPSRVTGVITRTDSSDGYQEDIEEVTVALPHPWRVLADGKRVLTLPIWFYCDDTSGNVSKKWNKHNSLLFTLAGLPREQAQLPFNIHFLGTSNIASPLEMFDDVVEQLRESREEGILAYHCEYDEVVLVMPWVLAMLGDNPMQSEFASHIGLTGKCFCRICHVRSSDKARPPGDQGEAVRLAEFLETGRPRDKAETVRALDEQLALILGGAPSNAGPVATETGSKDKYFQHFAERLAAHCAKLKSRSSGDSSGYTREALAEKMKEFRATLPDDLYNPALRLDDFDPHADTPVEVLHVVLLGFVKYFWRDAVSRQKAPGKATLIERIESLELSGLGVTRANGNTLVQYAGSLTGRDFRVVLQIAPAVLDGMIPRNHYEAWLALCRLASLVFQPVIESKTAYLTHLEDAIDDFLAATALWTTQWFNKPKFHILLHLVTHVRRFGPAILYATETFESYNYVIRLRSVHSNHHAPSVDIAHAFSHMHAIRHLVSGGYVYNGEGLLRAGPGVRDFLHDAVFLRLMGMNSLFKRSGYGKYSTVPKPTMTLSWESTRSGRAGCPMRPLNSRSVIRQCHAVILKDDDVARTGNFVLYRAHPRSQPLDHPGAIALGRIVEILADTASQRVISILIQRCTIGAQISPYMFPGVTLLDDFHLVPSLADCLTVVNVFHNCARNMCTSTETRELKQERITLDKKGSELTHIEPNDLVLNLAQLRSGALLSRFQTRTPRPDTAALIRRAIAIRHALDGTAPDDPAPEADHSAMPTASSTLPPPAASTPPAVSTPPCPRPSEPVAAAPEAGLRSGAKRAGRPNSHDDGRQTKRPRRAAPAPATQIDGMAAGEWTVYTPETYHAE